MPSKSNKIASGSSPTSEKRQQTTLHRYLKPSNKPNSINNANHNSSNKNKFLFADIIKKRLKECDEIAVTSAKYSDQNQREDPGDHRTTNDAENSVQMDDVLATEVLEPVLTEVDQLKAELAKV